MRLVFGLTVVLFFSCAAKNDGEITLPKLVSDGMVLQRDAKVKIWGWAAENLEIKVDFMGKSYTTVADINGDWLIELSDLKAGGPYEMSINDSVRVRDILVGDVWICSGQSNMELNMSRVRPLYEEEIANADFPKMRYFHVPRRYNFKEEEKDLEGGNWVSCNPETVLKYAGVAYFFGKELHLKYDVPIGLINSALGGSPIQAWMSEEALKKFPKDYEELQRFKSDSLIKAIENTNREINGKWYSLSAKIDMGRKDANDQWSDSNFDDTNWKEMNVPGYWADGDLGEVNGVVWFRKNFVVSKSMLGKTAKLNLGRIVDADSTFVNGQYVGRITYQYPPRRYEIPADLLKEGTNNITVRVINNGGKGGFVLDKPYEILSGDDRVDLTGSWKYQLGAKMERIASQTTVRWKPGGLYKAIIAPLQNYSMKGVIWFQGESNTNSSVTEYDQLFPAMIADWRQNWEQGEFPFLYVQLANFMEAKVQPTESNWARLREAQLKTLSVPNTGMAVAIDLGEWNDIHPLNKKDVGNRLALAAAKHAYGEEIVYSGPIYKSMEVKGSKIVLSFDQIGSGLKIQGGLNSLKEFAIAGADKNFVWAKAKIENNQVTVWNTKIQNPTAVRYGWASNPEKANLYNKEGLPASPFRTDDW